MRASTRSRPFFSGFAPYVMAAMSLCSGGPLASTGNGTITAPARGVGASARPPSLHGTSSGAALKRRASIGRCQMPWRPGRLPAAGASKRIAPGTGPSSAAVVLE